MGTLSTDLAPRPADQARLVRKGLACGLLAGLAGSLGVLLLVGGRRRVHLRRAREVLSELRYPPGPPSPPWP